MQKFPSIESLKHLVHRIRATSDFHGREYPTMEFTGTVKLHGTNAGVEVFHYDNGAIAVEAQGRNRKLTIESDNFGFAARVLAQREAFIALARGRNVLFFGEWVGTGIQKSVAVSNVPRHFVIFSVFENGEVVDINDFFSEDFNEEGIYFINQVPTYSVTIDFKNPQEAADIITDLTYEVEHKCPWGAFRGVESVGEGIVWVATDDPNKTDYWFKSKGVEHKKSGEKQQVRVDPVKVESIRKLVDEILPEWRLEQGVSQLRENNMTITVENTGNYIKWIHQDIIKEESDTIANNSFCWKDVVGDVSKRARAYYLKATEDEAFR